MKKSTIALLCLSLSALSMGCNKGASSTAATGNGSGGVAVVDIGRVFAAMGWKEEMDKNINETKSKVSDQFRDYLKPAQHNFETKREEMIKGFSEAKKEEFNKAKTKDDLIKAGLSEKQIEELSQMIAVFQQEDAAVKERFNQIVQAQANEILKRYGEAVKPAVRRVAIAGNKAIVLIPGPSLLYNDSTSDITDAVIDEMQHTPGSSKVDLPAPPTLTFQQPPPTPPSSSTPSTPPTTPAPATTTPPVTPPVAPRITRPPVTPSAPSTKTTSPD